MTTPVRKIEKEANGQGYFIWSNVLYEDMAIEIRDRLLSEQPKSQASLGLLPDDSFVVWYKPARCSWNY